VKIGVWVSLYVALRVLLAFWKKRSSSPHRPFLTVLLDTICEFFQYFKLGPWAKGSDISTGMELAIKRCGLTDLGTTTNFDFIKRYEVARSVGLKKSKAKFSPVGHYFIQESLTRRIEIRLQLVDYLKKHPNIEKIKMKPPIFVIGFPRTGTTFLHEMLGLNENVRSHYTWEQFDPIPTTNDESIEAQGADRKKRYNKNNAFFHLMFKTLISEDIQHIHRIGYDEPEECTIPCALELPYALTELPFNMYAIDELLPLGAGDAFPWYHKFLQMAEWQAPDRRDQDFTWMLKCPFHLPYLEELHRQFPDATVVWTHRDPAACVASACSLHETLMRFGMEEPSIDPKLLGAAVVNYTRRALDKAEETMAKLGDKFKMVHIRYADTVKDPKTLCKRVYEEAGLPYTDAYDRRLDEYLQKSKEERQKIKEKKGSSAVHEYKPEDYGLSAEGLRETFADYISKYNILEKK